MNLAEVEINIQVESYNKQAFAQFSKRLKRPFRLYGNHISASVILTCYRPNKLERYKGSVLLMNNEYEQGDIRITDGEKALRDEGIRQLLENTNRQYYVGRSGCELIVECAAREVNGIHRIDLEEL